MATSHFFHPCKKRRAFTLIELLVVIAIIAILAVVVVLTLNPAQLLAQSRDANRVSDMATLNSAINLYATDQSGASGYSLGTASTSYVSIPSTASNCSTLGLATSAFSYACSTSANYRNASSTGWIPLNFQSISAGSPLGNLPVDPVNASSSNLFYSYETNGSQYVLSSFMESQKYAKNMMTTGGVDPALYEAGSGANTLPDATRGLVGYWPLNEGSGSSTIDWSGYGNNGTWNGTATGTSGYYSAGHPWQWGGAFDGSSTYVNSSFPNALSGDFTVTAWIDPTANVSSTPYTIFYENAAAGRGGPAFILQNSGSLISIRISNPCYVSGPYATTPVTLNVWQQVGVSFSAGSGAVQFYINGAPAGSATFAQTFATTTTNMRIGEQACSGSNTNYFQGGIGDVRVYGRALSAAEIQEIYNAEK